MKISLWILSLLTAAEAAAGEPPSNLVWTDIRDLGVEGQGWRDVAQPYDRLPAKAEGKVPPAVWNLSRHSAGMHIRFVSDTTELSARWALGLSDLAMPHMAATGVSGLDLYVRSAEGPWRWLAVAKPTGPSNNVALISCLPSGKREYLLYLPLYNSTKSVELGIPGGATLARSGAWGPGPRKPIVF